MATNGNEPNITATNDVAANGVADAGVGVEASAQGATVDAAAAAPIWENCRAIVKRLLMNTTTRLYFGEPVHRAKFPQYYEVIKEPRDLNTIKAKLERQEYQDVYAFAADVRLCFENCRTFNPLGHPVRKMGDDASARFEKLWLEKNIEADWQNVVQAGQQAAVAIDAQQEQEEEEEEQQEQEQQPTSNVTALLEAARKDDRESIGRALRALYEVSKCASMRTLSIHAVSNQELNVSELWYHFEVVRHYEREGNMEEATAYVDDLISLGLWGKKKRARTSK